MAIRKPDLIRISRRALLAAATSAVMIRPAMAEDTDVVIIGAGAAGIGAARELQRLGKRPLIIEARQRSGGRLFTNTALGQPFDAGGAYIHFAETNPWSQIATDHGVDARGGYRLWSGSIAYRNGVALDGEWAARRAGLLRSVSDAYDEVEERGDVSLAQALRDEDQDVRDVGRIQAQMAAGEDPEWVSTSDWQRLEGGQNRLVPGGYGALAMKAAEPLGVRHGVTVTAIDWSGQLVVVTTDKGVIRARKAIVTVPIGVLKSGHIRFTPALPLEQARALDGLRMGALSKVALRFDQEKFGFSPHQFLSEVGDPARAMTFEAWPYESDLVVATFGGDYARGMAKLGETVAVDHALERFLKIAGGDARKVFRGGALAGWSEDRFSLGSYAVALPGRMKAREALAKPVGDRLWFAGEATAGVYSMTAGGAYIAGRDAAKQVAVRLSTGSLR
jgi:monoamine oxidase